LIFPIGEYVIFSLGLFALVQGLKQHSTRFWGELCLVWLVGRLVETILPWNISWHWHLSRLFVIAFFAGLAWQRTEGRKVLPSLMTALALAGQNLFAVNEPGIFRGDQWFLGGIVLLVAILATRDLWGMGLALAGGVLLDLGISVFLFQGIVRHYDLPDPFFWNLGVAFLASVGGVRTFGKLWHVRAKNS